jgi:Ca-activated chloride channel homolog
VAMFGMLLRNSEFKGNSDFKSVVNLAADSKGNDPENYRAEFVQLVKSAEQLYK